MKTCPVCQRPYVDETMIFCLADGAQLINVNRKLDLDATWRLATPVVDPPPTQIAPTVPAHQTDESKPLSTIQYRPELQMAPPSSASVAARPTRSVLPWVFAIVVVLAASGILIAWILTRDRTEKTLSTQLPPATQQSTPTDNAETKTAGTTEKVQGVNANSGNITKPNSSKTQPISAKALTAPTPSRKSPVVTERKQADVRRDNKKVNPPKPTGESFIPVKP
jgi:cytoskeletal protein RodZ